MGQNRYSPVMSRPVIIPLDKSVLSRVFRNIYYPVKISMSHVFPRAAYRDLGGDAIQLAIWV